jgi:MinD-like ATPase involved in chromosome partitioning or flagellar assembly
VSWLRLGRQSPGAGHLVDSASKFVNTPGPGRVVGVTGAGGAPGVTFLSVNLAVWLADQGVSVCLVDADPVAGAVASQLDLNEDRSLYYLAHESTLALVDDDLIDRHLQHFGGLSVLAGRSEPGLGAPIPAGIFETVIGLLRRRHQLLIIDLGRMGSPQTMAMAAGCQLLLWVVAPTPLGADLFDRTVTSGLATQLRPKPNLAVVNGVGASALAEAEGALLGRYGIPVVGRLPHHRPACLEAEAGHRPAVLGGPLAQPLRRLANSVVAAAMHPVEASAPGPLTLSDPGRLLPHGVRS